MVVKQQQMARAGSLGQVDRSAITGVALAGSSGVFGSGEVGVVDQQVHVPGKFQRWLEVRLFKLLHVRQICQGRGAVFEAIAQTDRVCYAVNTA